MWKLFKFGFVLAFLISLYQVIRINWIISNGMSDNLISVLLISFVFIILSIAFLVLIIRLEKSFFNSLNKYDGILKKDHKPAYFQD